MASATSSLQQTGYNYLLPKEDQAIIVKLKTGHCRLRHHMFTKLHTGHAAVCPCGTSPVTVEYLLHEGKTLWTLAGPPKHCGIRQSNKGLAVWASNEPGDEYLLMISC